MSKSRKKFAIIKDKTNHKWYNKIFRRVNKQRIKSNREPILMDELINQYDVCDWIYMAEYHKKEEEFRNKTRRK